MNPKRKRESELGIENEREQRKRDCNEGGGKKQTSEATGLMQCPLSQQSKLNR